MNRPRLTRRGWSAGQWTDVEVTRPFGTKTVELNELYAGEVHAGHCPLCGYSPLQNVDDVSVCPNCGAAYKTVEDVTVQLM